MGAESGKLPWRLVRKIAVCGNIPCSSSHLKHSPSSVPPPPTGLRWTGWPASYISTFCTAENKNAALPPSDCHARDKNN